jgi:hypothetical protein
MHGNNNDKRQILFLYPDTMTSKADPVPPDKAQFLEPWSRLATRLSPLIGESGFCALFARTCRLVSPQFAWLAVSPPIQSIDTLFASLGENLAAVDHATAGTANAVLLDTFTQLLSALIGQALTNRLLEPSSCDEDAHKNAQEHK